MWSTAELSIDDFSDMISARLSPTRTLTSDQPLPIKKREAVAQLIKEGNVPKDIKFTIGDYNLYVLPIMYQQIA